MAPLSLAHFALGLIAVIVGCVILSLRKGDPRHRVLGWIYVTTILASLAAILQRGAAHPSPFHAYAATIVAIVVIAILAARLRRRLPAWRSWHAALMSLSMIGAAAAMGGIAGGLYLGVGTGPAYYRMFNAVIVLVTAAGLWIVNTRPVIWGRVPAAREQAVRRWYSGFVVTLSLALVTAQWVLFTV